MNHDRLKVIIVDDDRAYLHYAQWILEEINIESYITDDCTGVLELIEEHDPDLLILDKMMEIDGLLIAETSIRKYPNLPVLIVSSNDFADEKKAALTLGCIDFIRKDYDKDAFLQRVLKYCHLGHLTNTLNKIEEKWDKATNCIKRR